MVTGELDRLRAENTHLQQELNEERGPGQDGYRKAVAHLHSENTRQASRLVELERVYEINAELTQANTRQAAEVERMAKALRLIARRPPWCSAQAYIARRGLGLPVDSETMRGIFERGGPTDVYRPASDKQANCQPETR